MRAPSIALVLVLVLVHAATLAQADVVVLTNGDRVSGKVVGRIGRRVRVQTPYGVLVIPADKVERILRDDGSVDVLNAPPTPAPTPEPAPVTLVVLLGGATFWQAWDPKSAPADPSLRLELHLDDEPIATYTDVNLDPEDLPKAVVNSFVFSKEQLFVAAGHGVTLGPPEPASAEVRLPITLSSELAGRRRLRMAYQVNDGDSAAPQWRAVVVAEGEVTLAPGETTLVHARQDRGAMEYARRRMQNVVTFRATLEAEAPAP